MIKALICMLVALLTITAVYASHNRYVVASVETDTPAHFVMSRKAAPTEWVSFKILLKEQNKDLLLEFFNQVSDPQSESYGKFFSKAEIDALTGASIKTVNRVSKFLLNHINKNEFTVHSDYIQVKTSVAKAEKIFDTTFFHYTSLATGKTRTRINGRAYIPNELAEHIDFVTGISEFIEDRKMDQTLVDTSDLLISTAAIHSKKNLKGGSNVQMTPSVIKSYYGVPSNAIATNSQTYQSIAAFDDFFAMGALQYFDQQYNIQSSLIRVNRQGPNCFGQGCDEYESDLDIQYVTSMALNASTVFINHPNGEWVLDWALQVAQYNPMPMVASISYGFSELEQCLLTSYCTSVGYDNLQYIERTNTAFQKLGLMGMSIFVSSGDDGAPSFAYSSGNCPIDTAHYCPLGGCASTSTQCPSFTIEIESNDTLCFFPMGVQSPSCAGILNSQDGVDAVNCFVQANAGSKCQAALEQDVQKNYHFKTTCGCSSLKTYSHNGFKVSGYTYDANNGALFYPDYPTSSPYVTSVGATQITDVKKPEVVCSIQTGAIITGGGGFSNLQPQPAYQQQAVSTFLSTSEDLPPAGSFNTSGRAYPDITLVGHAYNIAFTQETDKCPCKITQVDGTSCSSPTLAGMFTLINDKLLNAGATQLGFLNPLLYQAAAAQPNVFNDITVGNNNCNRAYCCEYGYTATTGYDPASGLGSIQFNNLEQYILSLKNVN